MTDTDTIKEDVMTALVHSTKCDQCGAKMTGVMAYVGFMAMEVARHAREMDEAETESV